MAIRLEGGNTLKLASIVVALVLLPLSASQLLAHPGIAPDARCSSCHGDKTRGKSVHAALAISCMVCHMLTSQGNATTIALTAPKEQICFGCHQRSTEADQHTPKVKGQCVDCHDSHSSARPMLLLRRNGKAHPR